MMDRMAVTAGTTVAALAVGSLGAWFLWRYMAQHRVFKSAGSLRDLRQFELERVLKVTDTNVALLGHFRHDPLRQQAVVLLHFKPFARADLHLILNSLMMHQIFENDIYSSWTADVCRNYKPFKINIIHPSTPAHVRKHTEQHFHLVRETKELYQSITLPFIESLPVDKMEWVFNILEYKCESERLLYDDKDARNGFVLLPDYKWPNMTELESLYCLAIVRDRTIRSLRDLNGSHLPLLRSIRDLCLATIEAKFKVPASSVRAYVHYQPSYYHFHVHFSHVKLMQGIFTGKAVLLDDIIYNLSRNSDHYQEATLTFVVGEMQHAELYEKFRDQGTIVAHC